MLALLWMGKFEDTLREKYFEFMGKLIDDHV